MTDGEVPLKVLGYHDDGIIVEVLADYIDPGTDPQELRHAKGDVFVAARINLIEREEVKFIPGEAEDEDGPAISWMELGGLSVALTRARDGAVLISFERAPGYPAEWDVTVRVALMNNGEDLWEGDIE
jgi:hypothetical protein